MENTNKVKSYLRHLNRFLVEISISKPTPAREEILKKKIAKYKAYIENAQRK